MGWYKSAEGKAKWGERTIPGNMNFTVSFADATFLLDITVERGREFGLWEHTFVMASDFELHEALTRWKFALRKADDPSMVLQTTTALGLLEFGNTLGNIM